MIAAALSEQVVAWRRHLHRHPELSFHEHETAAYVLDQLSGLADVELVQPTPTSVLARIVRGRGGRVVALRADLDALPIAETGDPGLRSEVDGVMHACGHDGHTAMLLGAAHLLAEAAFDGEARLLFQHAEEQPPGGARELVAAGVLDRVDAVVGCHLWTALPTGSVSVVPGRIMAGNDEFAITVTGSGGHAAMPHQTVDPLSIAAEIVTAVNQFVARGTDPLASLVLSVTQFNAGSATNVIPETAELAGTLRYLDVDVRERAVAGLERLVGGIAAAHGATHSLEIRRGYEPVVNDPALSARVEAIARTIVGDAALCRVPPVMGAEDFGALSSVVPGVFYYLGTGNEQLGSVLPHHHPSFTIDEASLGTGVELLAGIAVGLLGDEA